MGPISDTQLAVLQWLAAGQPGGVMEGHTYKTVAVALQSRRLVMIQRKRGVWTATLTEAGLHYLAHGSYPESHWTRSATSPSSRARSQAGPDTATPAGMATATTSAKDSSEPGPAPPVRATVTENPGVVASRLDPGVVLVDRVLTSGGVLRAEEREVWPDCRSLTEGSHRPTNLPQGKRLRHRRIGDWRSRHVELYFEDDYRLLVAERPVPVPQRVSTYHRAVQAYRADPDRHEVSPAALARASRILHALASEADRRGHHVTHPTTEVHQYNTDFRSSLTTGQLHVGVDGHTYRLRIREDGAPGGISHRHASPAFSRLPRWQRVRNTQFQPTGRLRIIIDDGYSRDGRPAELRDTKTLPLESRLPALLRELEVRALEDQARDRERAREAESRRREWEQAVETARHELREAHFASTLHDQLQRWKTARDLDDYLNDVRAKIEILPDGDAKAAAIEWLTWATNYRDSINPLRHPPTIPSDPDPTPEALAPFLHGHSLGSPD